MIFAPAIPILCYGYSKIFNNAGLMGRLNDVSREVRQLAVMVSYHILDHWIRLVCIQEKYVQEFTRLLRILVKEEDKSVREVAEGNFINPRVSSITEKSFITHLGIQAF